MNLTRENCRKCGGPTLHKTLTCVHCGTIFKPPAAAKVRIGKTGAELRKQWGSIAAMCGSQSSGS